MGEYYRELMTKYENGIDKAVEYIKDKGLYELDDLLNILKGEDEDD